MLVIYKTLFGLIFFVPFLSPRAYSQRIPASERICGKWESQAKTLRILVYTENSEFKAKVIWFSDTEGKPMGYWKDKKNPDPKLRNRTILGMSILRDLKYNSDKGTWENGMVYDSKHGKEWNASASIEKSGLLKVRGYWHFKWIGKSMIFHRIQ
ncbi:MULTISPECIES: DUF2147 domain-containing protein [unclassified Mucilaginibacter]|uniref:DUF2147 domain-containing protein n=1 Tax=unclassified Mucilaginibacter TaxID=2617802 RepID=UPI002AC8F7C0|nr:MULTISPECIES: DUF2147 domain-containing protein [unclassified Mucilaginibacter]MEB0262822.1 DUF2147 domain-containing protein [Mucilaginibacter sp. 10I4]MEB0277661.1 DUF2147 domain-containing protein [Mucilaginibacter sp. 10B2]MEB0299576.1 DUF2147 domain-containing protein [Mucilaginibacter sp. 5C4]WPX24711.1 DUF2147 domain-containing protein [Mucilaginibacter sp. 5C4]